VIKLLRQTSLELHCQPVSRMQCPTARKHFSGLCDRCRNPRLRREASYWSLFFTLRRTRRGSIRPTVYLVCSPVDRAFTFLVGFKQNSGSIRGMVEGIYASICTVSGCGVLNVKIFPPNSRRCHSLSLMGPFPFHIIVCESANVGDRPDLLTSRYMRNPFT